MVKSGRNRAGTQKYECHVRSRSRHREWRLDNPEQTAAMNRASKRRRRDANLCASCSQPKLSEWYCWDCLNKKAFGAIEREAQKWQDSQTTLSEMPVTQLVRLSG